MGRVLNDRPEISIAAANGTKPPGIFMLSPALQNLHLTIFYINMNLIEVKISEVLVKLNLIISFHFLLFSLPGL